MAALVRRFPGTEDGSTGQHTDTDAYADHGRPEFRRQYPVQQIGTGRGQVCPDKVGNKVASHGGKEEIDEQHGTQQRQDGFPVFQVNHAVPHIIEGNPKRQLIRGRGVVVADQGFGNAGSHVAGADHEKERMDRQGGVQDAGQDDAQNTLQGVFHGEVGVGLLQLMCLQDVGQHGAGCRREDAADDIAHNAQHKQDHNVGVRFREEEHQCGGKDDGTAFQEVADIHNLCLVETVAQYTAHRREEEQGDAVQRQVQALQEGVVVADLQDVETDGKVVKVHAQF